MQKNHSELLRQAFRRKKAEKASVTLSRMAQVIGVSAPFLSLMFRGRRPIPVRKLEKICEYLDIDIEAKEALYRDLLKTIVPAKSGVMAEWSGGERGGGPIDWQYPSLKTFSILEDAEALPILNATLLEDYDGSAEFIASLLNIDLALVNGKLEKLRRFGFLEEREGKLVKTRKRNYFRSATDKKSIRAFHASAMNRAQNELEKFTSDKDVADRIITTFIFTGPRSRIPEAKSRIAELLETMGNEFANEAAEEVYQLSAQFFPVSKRPDIRRAPQPKGER